jgi:hypothetical protein
MSMLLRVLPALLLFAATIAGQKEQSGEDVKASEDLRRAKAAARGERAAKGEMAEGTGEAGEKDESDSRLTPEERLARHVTSGAQAYCRLQASLKPEKLMPGQSGVMTILATLQGDAVLPAPPPTLEVLNAAQQGEVTLGTLSARPAVNGRHARGYLGRPVYDNYALLDVPVTMSANAQLGSKHVVAVELKFDLYDGNSAQPIGRFLDRVSTMVEVGKVLDPAVQGGVRAAATTPPPTGEPAVPPPQPQPAAVRTATEPVRVDPNPIAPASTPTASPELPASDSQVQAPSAAAEDGGLPVPLLIGGGVLLLAVILLLARRR